MNSGLLCSLSSCLDDWGVREEKVARVKFKGVQWAKEIACRMV